MEAIEVNPSYILVNAPVVVRIQKNNLEALQTAQIIYQGTRTQVPLRDEKNVWLAEFTLGEPGNYIFQMGNQSHSLEVHAKEDVSLLAELSLLGLCVLVILMGFIRWDRNRKKSAHGAGSI